LRRHFDLGRTVWTQRVAAQAGKTGQVHGVPVPGWLIDGGADVSAIAMLALLEVDRAEAGADAPTRALLTQLGDGVAQYQLGAGLNYPWGMHPDDTAAPYAWHAWGSAQAFALARAGKQLGRADWVTSARKEADLFFTRLVVGPMAAEWGVLPLAYPQIAYGVNSLTQAFLALYTATGDVGYAQRAGLTAGWFFGNNAAGAAMYDPTTGRGFDGLQGANEQRINRNAGAESTIESLMALLAVTGEPAAAPYLPYKPVAAAGWRTLEAEDAQQTHGDAVASFGSGEGTGEARWSNGHYLTLGAGDTARLTFSVPAADSYYLYAAYLKQQVTPRAFAAEALRVSAPPAIDGRLDDWQAAQPLSATQTLNIVRGAAGWGGADTDSFVGYLTWDAANLYVAAHVFSPQHHQTGTAASVWQGDTLWVYLTNAPDRTLLDAKLTLAQTPDGPQVWDWKAGVFLAGAKLAWQQGTGGYTYEAALPWTALNVRAPHAGQSLGVELGRGCCGSGFMDLGGKDPDIAANLTPLHLVDQLAPGRGAPTLAPSGPDAVALRWRVDGGRPGLHPEGGAADRDYLFLERLDSAPRALTAGEHTLDLEYAGLDPARQITLDGFLLLPATLQKTLQDAQGRRIQISFAADGGKFTLTGP
jgi:hypothetical protein